MKRLLLFFAFGLRKSQLYFVLTSDNYCLVFLLFAASELQVYGIWYIYRYMTYTYIYTNIAKKIKDTLYLKIFSLFVIKHCTYNYTFKNIGINSNLILKYRGLELFSRLHDDRVLRDLLLLLEFTIFIFYVNTTLNCNVSCDCKVS